MSERCGGFLALGSTLSGRGSAFSLLLRLSDMSLRLSLHPQPLLLLLETTPWPRLPDREATVIVLQLSVLEGVLGVARVGEPCRRQSSTLLEVLRPSIDSGPVLSEVTSVGSVGEEVLEGASIAVSAAVRLEEGAWRLGCSDGVARLAASREGEAGHGRSGATNGGGSTRSALGEGARSGDGGGLLLLLSTNGDGRSSLEEGVKRRSALLALKGKGSAVGAEGGGRRVGSGLRSKAELGLAGEGAVRSVSLRSEGKVLRSGRRGERRSGRGGGRKGALLLGRVGRRLLDGVRGHRRGRSSGSGRLSHHLGRLGMGLLLIVSLGSHVSRLEVLLVVAEGRREGVVALLGRESGLVAVLDAVLHGRVVHGHALRVGLGVVHELLGVLRELLLLLLLTGGGVELGGRRDSGRSSDSRDAVRKDALVAVLAGAEGKEAAGNVASDIARREVGVGVGRGSRGSWGVHGSQVVNCEGAMRRRHQQLVRLSEQAVLLRSSSRRQRES